MTNKIRTILKAALVLFIALFAIYEATKWTVMRVYVPQGKALMVINKFGDQLPPDLIAVPENENHYKGVQEQLRSPGRYFINPVEYDTQLVDLTVIPAGDPQSWRFSRDGHLEDEATQPKVGLIACKQGKT